MKIAVYNQKGEKIGTTLLPKEIFEIKMNPDLVHQVIISQMANQRKIIAHTKDRSEVRGGGRKPWQQKGLGRARHGSIRSPLWKGGGVTFGPRKERVFKKNIPKKMRRKALFMALSDKVKNNFLILVDKLKINQPKTKLISQIIENLKLKLSTIRTQKDFKRGSILIALPEMDKNIILAARNIIKLKTIQAKDLNCLDLLSFKYLIVPKESIKVIKKTFMKLKVKSEKLKIKIKNSKF